MKTFLLKYANRNTCLALVILVTVAISAQQLMLKRTDNSNFSFYNNYIIFKQSSSHLLAGKDLYQPYPNEYWDYYKYSPAFSLFFSAFAMLPDWAGLTLWNLLNALVFFFALWKFPFASHEKKLLAFVFTFVELTTSLHNAQSNGLIAGLRKLERGVEQVPMSDASPATAHMFIVNPFRDGGLTRLFSTHPSTEERIARLEAMRGNAFRLSPVQTR